MSFNVNEEARLALKNVYSTSDKAYPSCVCAIGHPLLDISADVELNFLDKYNLKKNDMILCPENIQSIYNDIQKDENLKITYLPGGSSMNTIRSIQWALKNQSEAKGATFCTGTVGNDKNADRMHSAADYAGVAVKYFKVNEAFEDQKVHRDSGNCSENSSSSSSMSDITSNNLFNAGSNSSHSNPKCNLPTGCCAVLITENGQNRSLITNLAAAKIYPKKFLKSIWEERIETAKYFYAPGFFLSTENNQGLETLKMVGEHCLEKNKVFITNISAPFVCTVFKKELAEIISYADVVFGNDFEYLAWGAANPDIVPEDKREDLKFINTCVANMPKADKSKPRLAITTRGDKSTLISQGEKCFEIPIHVVPEKELVDTNGAGDAFVAGFMCGLIYNQSIIDCLDSANKVATSIIKMPGCTFPQESLLKF